MRLLAVPRPVLIAIALAAVPLAGCPASIAAPPVDTAPTFQNVQTLVFSNCTTRSCHGDAGRKGGLTLTADVAYDQLVDKPAENDGAKAKGKIRVKPGDPAGSYLLQKLEGPAAGEGERMPNRGPGLPPESIDLVRRWIAAGCPK